MSDEMSIFGVYTCPTHVHSRYTMPLLPLGWGTMLLIASVCGSLILRERIWSSHVEELVSMRLCTCDVLWTSGCFLLTDAAW